jgi:hypothetical protein
LTAEYLIPPLTFKSWLSTGAPNAFGTLTTYAAGTNTLLATYTDSTGVTQNTNPVQLNSRGEANVWVPPNTAYKFVEADSFGNQIKTTDQVINNFLVSLYGGIDSGAANAYILTFSATFTSYTNGTVIWWVPSNNNTGASTVNVNGLGVVSIVNPNGSALGANQVVAGQLTQIVYYNGAFELQSLANFTGNQIGTFGTETAIASAATTDLGSAQAHVVQVTGTTPITSFGSSANVVAPIYLVRFTGALTLTYSSTALLLPGGASIVTSPGDALLAEYQGAGLWQVLFYQYSAGSQNTKIKPADTARTSNAVLTADPDLQSNTLANGRYSFEIYLVFDSTAGAAGFQWTNDGTAIDSRGVVPALASGYINTATYGPKSDTFYGTTITYSNVSTTANSNQVLYKGSILVSTMGTLGVSWAQAVSTASATTLRAGSYLTVSQINVGTAATGTTHTYTSGSGTETVPSGYNHLTIEVWGSGAGGGGYAGSGDPGGGGGGGGGYCRTVFTVTGLGGDTVTYSVGAGGAIEFPGNASSVTAGTLAITNMTANGGTQGANGTITVPGSGGPGGTATGGTAVNTTGNSGAAGQVGSLGGNGGSGISGVYGSGGAGGKGQGNITATAGQNGLIIFTYST